MTVEAGVRELEAPLLELEGARIARADGSIGESQTFRVDGPRACLVGRFSDFFALLAGQATLAAGSARVAGAEASQAVRQGRVGLALYEPTLPPKLTATRFLEENALLAGFSRRETARAVAAVVARFELASRAGRKLGELSPIERRAFVLAAATLGDPAVICVEAPLYRLDATAQTYIEGVLFRAGEGRKLVVSVPELPAAGGERTLADALGNIVHEGGMTTPATGSTCVVSLLAGGETFCKKLDERGLSYRALGVDPLLMGLATAPANDLLRVMVELKDGMSANDLFVLAAEVDATLIELLPM